MAKTTVVTLVDDLDGSTADETVTFALDGVSFEIDLSTRNASRLRAAFAPFVEAGTKLTSGGARETRTTISAQGQSLREETRAIRAWAQRYGAQLGLAPIGDRGAIPQRVREAYDEHEGRAPSLRLPSPFLPPTS